MATAVVEVSDPRYQAVCEACGESSSETGVSELVAEDWQANHASQHDALEGESPEIRIVEVGDE